MRLPTAALCAWFLSERALGIKKPPAAYRELGQRTEDTEEDTRVNVEIDKFYGKMLNECSKNTPNFLHDLVGLKRTIPKPVITEMESTFKNTTGPAYLLTTSVQLTCMVDNFLVHLSKTKREPIEVVLFSLDQTSHDWCTLRQNEGNILLHCIHMQHWIQDQDSSAAESKKSNGEPFDSCNYIKVTWAKPMILYHAARMSKYGVLMIDSDIIVHKDMFAWIQENKKNTTELMAGDDRGPRFNSGTAYADHGSLKILEEWTDNAGVEEIVQSPRGEQEALIAVVNKDGNWKRIQKFSRDTRDQGSVGQCAEIGQLATHYNCIHQKIWQMGEHGFWSPRDPDCRA